jgi:biopolymer transport protein ExbD
VTYRVDGRPVEASLLAGTLRSRLAIRQEPALLVSADRSLTYNDVAQAVAVARAAGAAPIGLVNTAESTAGR